MYDLLSDKKYDLSEYEMKTKKKLSITIDENLYEAVDQASRRYKVARSQLAQEALTLWLKKKTEAIMAKGYKEMAEEDLEAAESALPAQREVL
jgi:metal-responsive CopG/Arc/MetJ family transcriptional regulator